MARRFTLLAAAIGLVLVLVPTSLAATVTVRVEGKTRTIFGPLPVEVEAANALQALDRASVLGEFYVGLSQASFGTYVSQIGLYPAAGTAGWVFKVNGASPPVGADQVSLRDGDQVLWYYAVFADTGGPSTLALKAVGRNCYAASSRDDTGATKAVAGAQLHVDGRRLRTNAAGRACVGRHSGLVRAYAVGAVRSNAVK